MLNLTRSRLARTAVDVHGRRAGLLEVLGAVLFAAAGAWMSWTSVESGASALPGMGLLLACGLVLLAVRSMGARARVVVPPAALLAAIFIAARSKSGILSTAPLAGPLGYGNADAAFYVQAAIAGLMLAFTGSLRPLRIFGVVAAGAFAVLPIILHSLAAAWLVFVLPGIGLAAAGLAGPRGARASIVLFGMLFVVSLAGTIFLGASYSRTTQPSSLQRAAVSAVDEHRLVLWHDAFVIMRDHPVNGVGPRRYQVVSPIASRDADSRWAHNEFLQQGAEGGAAGLVLLAALFVWAFSRLLVVRVPDAITALSAASLAALGIHACIDYVMHYPAVPIMAAGLAAIGMHQQRKAGEIVP